MVLVVNFSVNHKLEFNWIITNVGIWTCLLGGLILRLQTGSQLITWIFLFMPRDERNFVVNATTSVKNVEEELFCKCKGFHATYIISLYVISHACAFTPKCQSKMNNSLTLINCKSRNWRNVSAILSTELGWETNK